MDLPNLDSLHWHLLPVKIQEIAERCGRDVAAALLRKFDGRRVRVPDPENITEEYAIAAIGLDLAKRLAMEYAYEWIHVPRAYKALLQLRNQAIIDARARGVSIAALADQWRMTERQIYKILAGVKIVNDRQGSLF
jgi:Mor family transcriptional regulator